MAIPWLIGAAVVGLAGAVASAISDDDSSSSSSSSSSSRQLEREREEAERLRQEDIDRVEKEQEKKRIARQNANKAQHFINKYSLSISSNELVAAKEGGNLRSFAIQAYQSTTKFKEHSQKIQQLSQRYELILEVEPELGEL